MTYVIYSVDLELVNQLSKYYTSPGTPSIQIIIPEKNRKHNSQNIALEIIEVLENIFELNDRA
jgi:hypothetical protein